MVTEGEQPALTISIGEGLTAVHFLDVGLRVELNVRNILAGSGETDTLVGRAELTSSPSRNEKLSLSATYFATVDFPHAVGPVKKKTYRGRVSVGLDLSTILKVPQIRRLTGRFWLWPTDQLMIRIPLSLTTSPPKVRSVAIPMPSGSQMLQRPESHIQVL